MPKKARDGRLCGGDLPPQGCVSARRQGRQAQSNAPEDKGLQRRCRQHGLPWAAGDPVPFSPAVMSCLVCVVPLPAATYITRPLRCGKPRTALFRHARTRQKALCFFGGPLLPTRRQTRPGKQLTLIPLQRTSTCPERAGGWVSHSASDHLGPVGWRTCV